jgi:hypothetical protein
MMLSFSSATLFSDLSQDMRHNVTHVNQHIFQPVSHLFPLIRSDITSVVTRAETYQMTPIKSTVALASQRRYPAFTWMDTQRSLRMNRFAYCPIEDIHRFQCIDCAGQSLQLVYQSPSSDATQVMVVSSDSSIMVIFRGALRDSYKWLATLDTQQTPFLCKNCKVHSEFHSQFIDCSEKVIDVLTELYEKDPSRPIHITGHSIGAAVATIFAVHVSLSHPSLVLSQVITFGSPRVGNREFVKMADAMLGNKWFRIINQLDMIAAIPTQSAGFFHVGQLVTCTTGTTVCVIEGRNTENHDGIQADWLRIVESFDNMQLCHYTYLKESIGRDKYICNSKIF